MAPPAPPNVVNAEVVSGITGSISIACWIIVFAPQIYQNFTRKSAEGLSLLFVVLWLLGDVFNVIGAIMQGVLPTMVVLAIYYTLADIVLLWQCFHYGTHSKVDPIHLSPANPLSTESEPLLETIVDGSGHHHNHNHNEEEGFNDINGSSPESSASSSTELKSDQLDWVYNIFMVFLVLLAGVGGWYFGGSHDHHKAKPIDSDLEFNPFAQAFGWLCAALYLGSRIPQILLNYERKSCEGISFLFFLFACLGNITYVVSILSVCTGPKYLLVNSSWLAGSMGTLVEDFIIFIQFFLYNEKEIEEEELA